MVSNSLPGKTVHVCRPWQLCKVGTYAEMYLNKISHKLDVLLLHVHWDAAYEIRPEIIKPFSISEKRSMPLYLLKHFLF